MNEDKYRFPIEQIESYGIRTIRMQQGFSLEIDTLLAWATGRILEDLPEEMKEVFPVNIERKLRKMGIGKEFEIVHNLTVATRIIRDLWKDDGFVIFKRYLGIRSLDIRVSVVAKEVGDFVCNFQVLTPFPSEDKPVEIKGYPSGSENGKWELLIGGRKKIPEGWLSFEEAAEKLKTAAGEFRRKEQERMEAEARGTEGLKLLFT